MGIEKAQYSPLLSEVDSEDGFQRTHEKLRSEDRLRRTLKCAYFTILHIALGAIMFSALAGWLRLGAQDDFRLWPAELPFAKDFVEYETITFDPSGFNDLSGPATPYEGRPTPEKEALWYNLTRVGMYSLTEDEYNTLNITTTKANNAPEQRLVTIEVFHQLHCLNYLRRRIYEENGEHFQVESDWSREQHLSHCIDYLRQVLMCHADLTPITIELVPGKYKPDFSIKHTCRNWDRVYEFAKERNISGTGIE